MESILGFERSKGQTESSRSKKAYPSFSLQRLKQRGKLLESNTLSYVWKPFSMGWRTVVKLDQQRKVNALKSVGSWIHTKRLFTFSLHRELVNGQKEQRMQGQNLEKFKKQVFLEAVQWDQELRLHYCQQEEKYFSKKSMISSCRVEYKESDRTQNQMFDVVRSSYGNFFAQRACKRVKGVTDVGLKPRKVQKVGVLGGGLMGSGIATALLLAGREVFLKEINDKFLQGGIQRIRSNLESNVRRGKMTSQQLESTLNRLTGCLDYNRFNELDMVIEAAIEKVDLKQQIFLDLERYCRSDAILATNTSTIDINIVGQRLKESNKKRVLGAHFFSPAHIMPLLEIVRTEKTSPQVILDTLEIGQAIKKTCVVVGNCTGFAVNRVFFPYTMGAFILVDLGLDPYMIDKVIKGMGMPSGPFRLSDLVGGDIGMHVGKNFVEAFPERVYRSMLLPLMNKEGRLGEKTGKGFYIIGKKRKATPDPQGLAPILAQSRSVSEPLLGKSRGIVLKPKEIVEFIFLPVINEGCRVVEEGIVDKPSDLDVCAIMAMGFPPVLGGLMFWGDLMGAKYIVQKLKQFQQMVPGVSGYFEPSKYLLDCAQTGRKLIGGVGTKSNM
eukprot:TRINITY_DN10733_c0_g1_i2.p2 TRINITY_DN10733_c0_g1~~TRINITY_DN10733_c0_g1_i2.p2  ORF type:complete len:610 (-),score=77.54 TRINITY_DN10733_c0_g1_i2:476-2305(-)